MNKKAIILAILANFLWSTAFLGIKSAIHLTTPLFFAGFRFMISGLLLLPLWIGVLRLRKQLVANWRFLVGIGVLQTFFTYALFYNAFKYVDGAMAAIIIGSGPILTAITTHFFIHNDKMTKKKMLTLICGFSGIVLIALSKKPFSVEGSKTILGIALLLTSSIGSIFANIFIKKSPRELNPVLISSVQLFSGGTLLFLSSFAIEGIPDFNFPMPFWLTLAWLGFLSAAAFGCWMKALLMKDVKISDLNVWKFIIPVSGAILCWIFLENESPAFWELVGMTVVATSIVVYNRVIKAEKA